mgnify:CR=1 FL=1
MKKSLENIAIGLGIIIVSLFVVTGTYVLAKNPNSNVEKSYYVEKEVSKDYSEKDLVLATAVTKKIETAQNSVEYAFVINKGNVILVNKNNGSKSTVYSKGNAKALSIVDYYYYNSKYILIELPRDNFDNQTIDYIYDLTLIGYKVIIAHIERYTYFQNPAPFPKQPG